MLFMALMILPVLAVEYFWAQAIEDNPALRIVLNLSVGLIWILPSALLVRHFSQISKAGWVGRGDVRAGCGRYGGRGDAACPFGFG